MNLAILIGRLANDPELRTTSSGVSCCTFTMAVDRDFKGKDGNKQADFLKIVAWRQTGEFIHRYFKKGQRIALEGTIQTRSYDDKDGAKVYVTEVVVGKAEFVESKQYGQTQAPPQSAQQTTMDEDDDELPF